MLYKYIEKLKLLKKEQLECRNGRVARGALSFYSLGEPEQ